MFKGTFRVVRKWNLDLHKEHKNGKYVGKYKKMFFSLLIYLKVTKNNWLFKAKIITVFGRGL